MNQLLPPQPIEWGSREDSSQQLSLLSGESDYRESFLRRKELIEKGPWTPRVRKITNDDGTTFQAVVRAEEHSLEDVEGSGYPSSEQALTAAEDLAMIYNESELGATDVASAKVVSPD